MEIIVGMSGASGAIYGIELLRQLRQLGVKTHLVMTKAAVLTINTETSHTAREVQEMATYAHVLGDVGASIASGSYKTLGMVIAPCSIKTLSGVVNCYEDNLLLRAAGVCLKERRPLVLMVRETPLHRGHLKLLAEVGELGATVFPPVPAFYNRPSTLGDIVEYTCGRVLDQFGLTVDIPRWGTQEPGDRRDTAGSARRAGS